MGDVRLADRARWWEDHNRWTLDVLGFYVPIPMSVGRWIVQRELDRRR